MTDSGPAAPTRQREVPGTGAIAKDRIARLRARIEHGTYPLHPTVVAEAILARDEEGPCGSTRAIELALTAQGTSTD